MGDDPMTLGQEDAVQLIRCDFPNDATQRLVLGFAGSYTLPLPGSANALDVQRALHALPTIGQVSVTFDSHDGTAASLCSDYASISNNIVKVTFLSEFGSLPDLVLRDPAGHPLTGVAASKLHVATGGDGLLRSGDGATLLSTEGTKESIACSGRGTCEAETGTCVCYTGFGSSNGRGDAGQRGDCGHDRDPITSCPGIGIECSGHGVCSGHPEYACACVDGWAAGDCSQRLCPAGAAWFDAPVAPNKAHSFAECSAKGICNRVTGKCECQDMFEGEACERMTCPGKLHPAGVCAGHGRCMKMSELAMYATDNGDATPFSYGEDRNKAATWDHDKVFGCLCDAGWQGYDCTEQSCPHGDDVTTTGQSDEVQSLTCRYIGSLGSPPTFSLKFRQHVTSAIAFSATAGDIEAALEALPSIEDVSVVFSDSAACTTSGNTMTVLFHTENGDLPSIQVVANTGFTLGTDLDFPATLQASEVVRGTTENEECSGRGLCQHETGQCACFPGFGSSDGSGGPGGRGDCGYREPYNPVDSLRHPHHR